jgi:hypothetical protein
VTLSAIDIQCVLQFCLTVGSEDCPDHGWSEVCSSSMRGWSMGRAALYILHPLRSGQGMKPAFSSRKTLH